MTNGVVTLDDGGRVVTCNAAGAEILQCQEADLVGRAANEIFGRNPRVVGLVGEVRDTGESVSLLDVDLVMSDDADEQTVSVNMTGVPLRIEANDEGTILLLENISSEKRVRSTMARYMDPALADRLVRSDEEILGGKSTVATVLFSDIRSFTTLSEQLGPQATVSMLNEYFTLMVDCIQVEEGMLDKFIGDAIMAAFGLPEPRGDDEDRAVRCAIAMIRSMNDWNVGRAADGKPPIDMGIGLNTDAVVAGNIGSAKRMDFTVIGDGVNLAARLESACKQYNAEILISDMTFAKLKGVVSHARGGPRHREGQDRARRRARGARLPHRGNVPEPDGRRQRLPRRASAATAAATGTGPSRRSSGSCVPTPPTHFPPPTSSGASS